MTEFVSKIPNDWASFQKTAYQNGKAAAEQNLSEEVLRDRYNALYSPGSFSWHHRDLANVYRKFLIGEITKEQGSEQVQQIKKELEETEEAVGRTIEFLEAVSKTAQNVNKTCDITFQCPCGATAQAHVSVRKGHRTISAKCNACRMSIIS